MFKKILKIKKLLKKGGKYMKKQKKLRKKATIRAIISITFFLFSQNALNSIPSLDVNNYSNNNYNINN